MGHECTNSTFLQQKTFSVVLILLLPPSVKYHGRWWCRRRGEVSRLGGTIAGQQGKANRYSQPFHQAVFVRLLLDVPVAIARFLVRKVVSVLRVCVCVYFQHCFLKLQLFPSGSNFRRIPRISLLWRVWIRWFVRVSWPLVLAAVSPMDVWWSREEICSLRQGMSPINRWVTAKWSYLDLCFSFLSFLFTHLMYFLPNNTSFWNLGVFFDLVHYGGTFFQAFRVSVPKANTSESFFFTCVLGSTWSWL